MTAQLVSRAESALLKSIGPENVQTAYWPYFTYDSRTILLHALTSPSVEFSPRFQRESLCGVERPVRTE